MASATKKPAGRRASRIEREREVSAGGVVWRRDPDGRICVVLVKPAGKDSWTLPKGNVEPAETAVEAAIREVSEETGLTVANAAPLGDVSYVYSRRKVGDSALVRIFKTVHFFLMEHAGGDTAHHDREIDEVAWVDIGSAHARASYQSERDLIAKAREILAR